MLRLCLRRNILLFIICKIPFFGHNFMIFRMRQHVKKRFPRRVTMTWLMVKVVTKEILALVLLD